MDTQHSARFKMPANDKKERKTTRHGSRETISDVLGQTRSEARNEASVHLHNTFDTCHIVGTYGNEGTEGHALSKSRCRRKLSQDHMILW